MSSYRLSILPFNFPVLQANESAQRVSGSFLKSLSFANRSLNASKACWNAGCHPFAYQKLSYHSLRHSSTAIEKSARNIPLRPGFSLSWEQHFHSSDPKRYPRRRQPSSDKIDHGDVVGGSTTFALSETSIRRIFRGELSREDGNALLSALQRNRRNGRPEASIGDFAPPVTRAGLDFLRTKYPVDEDAAILGRIDNDFQQQFREPQTNLEHSSTGRSQIDIMKEENKRRNERQEAHCDLEKSKAEHQTDNHLRNQSSARTNSNEIAIAPRTFKELLDPGRKPRDPPDWVKRYRDNATQVDIPVLSLRERLFPSGILTVAVVLLSLWFADTYIPPSSKARLFPDTPPAAATLQALVCVNIMVFLLWRVPPMWSFMNKYFVNLPLKPRAPQMLLAAFSHQDVPHLCQNMILLWLVGVHLCDDIGRGPFLALVFSSAALCSYGTLVVHTLRNLYFTAAVGGSGIVTALIAASCILHEGRPVRIPFLPKEWTSWINTGVVLAFIIAQELVSIRKRGMFRAISFEKMGLAIDWVGHLTGFMVGTLAAIRLRQTDPRWRDIERSSFWYSNKDAGKTAEAELESAT